MLSQYFYKRGEIDLAVILWLACAVICYLVAQSKGRNPVIWFIGGGIFGIFAVALLLLPRKY